MFGWAWIYVWRDISTCLKGHKYMFGGHISTCLEGHGYMFGGHISTCLEGNGYMFRGTYLHV